MKSTNNFSASASLTGSDDFPVQSVSVRRIEANLKRQTVWSKVFVCVGAAGNFPAEVDALRKLGWSEEVISPSESSSSCLLFAVGNADLAELESTLHCHPHVQLVLVRAKNGTKKTSCLALLESRGFRILQERDNVTFLSNIGLEAETLAADRMLDDPEVQSALQMSWCRIRNLPAETSVDLLSVQAPLLLVPDRFDIAIKVMYARLWRTRRARSWRDYAYFEHAIRITGPGLEICEHDGSGKSGIDQFKVAFHSLIAELEPTNIPAVPTDSNWTAFDGAHRIAAAITMNRDVHVARIKANSQSLANAKYFSGKSNDHAPCPPEILDEAAIEYCRVKCGLILALIFPTVASEAFAINQLEQFGQIVYRKDIILSPEAGMGLLRQVYLGHAWTEESGEDSGFIHKVKSCFPFHGIVRAILLDACDPSAIRPTKELIRSHYGIGNHSIHFTDGDDEALRLARIVFNENSIELLRLGVGKLPKFHQMLFAYRNWLEVNSLDDESFCIDGSAVLSLLELRECRDLDFLFHGDPGQLPATPERIDCHNEVAHYHRHPIEDLVGDPRLHCWYMGLKFCTPRIVLEMKEHRCEGKDFSDAALLRSRLPIERSRVLKNLTLQVMRMQANLRVRFAIVLSRIKAPLRPIVRAIRKHFGR